MEGKYLSKKTGIVLIVVCIVTVSIVAVIFYFIGIQAGQTDSHTGVQLADTKTDTSKSSTNNNKTSQNGRLPRNIRPILYQVEIMPAMYGDDPSVFYFRGFVRLKFKCIYSTHRITMNINKLEIVSNSIAVANVNTTSEHMLRISQYTQDAKWQFLNIELTTNLTQGEEYFVQMNFTGPLKTDFAGLYLSTFPHRTTNKYVAATQFSPTDARKAFPNLDEPDRKAVFEITLIRHKDLMSLSNMRKLKSVSIGNNLIADVYERTPKMSTYLLAFVVGDFTHKEIQARPGLNFTAWARSETINKMETALKFGAKVLTFFEGYFGINFPLPKQDILAVPETAVGAMENWGLIIYNENRVYYSPEEYSLTSLAQSVNTISHEIAHQWFGNLATMDWWSDLMLKEGFASYFADIGTDQVYPDWHILDQFAVLIMQDVFNVDGLTSSHPVYMELYDTTQIRQVFDPISYKKGACMIRLLHFILGDDNFQGGLKAYLNRFKYSNANHNDLWNVLETRTATNESQDFSITEVMNTWVLQKNYPVVTIQQLSKGRLRISQERFLNNGRRAINDTQEQNLKYVWKIPFTFTTSKSPSFSQTFKDIIWMNEKTMEIYDKDLPDLLGKDSWIISNIKQWGYYRVNYDLSLWNNIINQINTDPLQIHVTNRAQIINDLFSLSRAKIVSLEIALNALDYLKKEFNYIPWKASVREIVFLDRFIANTKLYDKFSQIVLDLIINQLNHFRDMLNPEMTESLLYADLFALGCYYGHKNCIDTSKFQFDQWKQVGTRLNLNLRSAILCSAVKHGEESDWNFVLEKYNSTFNVNEKYAYLRALACTKNGALQDRLITLTTDTTAIQGRDAISALTLLAGNRRALNKVWNHVTKNWDKFMETYSGSLFLLGKLVKGITKPFITETHLSKLVTFIKLTDNLGPAKQAFDQARETTESNVKWLNENFNHIDNWLKTERS